MNPTQIESMNKENKIKHAVEQLIEKGNFEIIDETFSTNYIAHAGKKKYSGHSFIKRFINQLHTSIPDIKIVDISFLVSDENKVAWQRTLEGTHKADMQGIPASGKKVIWAEMLVSRFENEKITEEWLVSELMGELLLKVPRFKK